MIAQQNLTSAQSDANMRDAAALVVAALAGTDRDNTMTAEQIAAATGELPLVLDYGQVAPAHIDTVEARTNAISRRGTGYYLVRVRDNGRGSAR